MTPDLPPTHLRAGGVSLVVDLPDDLLPVVRHWGTDLGDLTPVQLADLSRASVPPAGDNPFDVADRITVLPEHGRGWVGRPGVQGSREGRDWSPVWRRAGQELRPADGDGQGGGQVLRVEAADLVAGLALAVVVELTGAGLLRLRAELTNTGETPYMLGGVRLTLPVPGQAGELLDFTGRHTRERVPQRRAFTDGLHAREVRMGRPGLDGAYVLVAGEPGFGFRHGQVWGVHLGWSGNQELYAERPHHGAQLLGGGELLEHGEVRLTPGESYRTPTLFGSCGEGLDELAGRFHRHLRSQATHPRRPRPVSLNTWEAVYFDHRLDRLTALADRAAAVGVERFVLDDGWFSGRRDDTSSLGDWTVSAEVWPDGLRALVDHVQGLGMEFGLWVEPEMVSPDSHIARAHPEWLFGTGGRPGLLSRHQLVLDLSQPGAYAHVHDALMALLGAHDIAYLKWDHNRPLHDAGHAPGGEAGVHRHTMALYRLMDALRAAQPGLEIESCAGGGGRVDLGIMEHADRVWASDSLDPLDRQHIQRWTQLLLPPELIGTHLGAPRSHTTHRTHDLPFRAQTAIWGHLGIEWDLTTVGDDELEAVRAWVAWHKEHRALLHTGTVVNGDHPDEAMAVHGVVSHDGTDALYDVTQLRAGRASPPGRVRLPGLHADRDYRLSLAGPHPHLGPVHLPPWADDGVQLPGRVLADVGVQSPALLPEHSLLLSAEAVGGPS